jgi:hypothetical protein
MQGIRRFKPSTVCRRFSVAAGFYRTCVVDGILEHSPAEHVGRPSVPAESPTLGFTYLQFEALLTAARSPRTRGVPWSRLLKQARQRPARGSFSGANYAVSVMEKVLPSGSRKANMAGTPGQRPMSSVSAAAARSAA